MSASRVAPRPAELVHRHRLVADRRLGQHFLYDPAILERIAAAAAPFGGVATLEVGPGPGGLTRALLEAGADPLWAIERDPRFVAALRELDSAYPGRLRLVTADARLVPLASLDPARPFVIVANLPFNVGTELLLGWLDQLDRIARFVLMFQKEVADRLVARPHSADYGRLSVLVQACLRVERLFDLAPGAFQPPPKVAASVVRLEPRPDRPNAMVRAQLERLTAVAFGRRRKMLRANLRRLGPEVLERLAALGVSPTARAEEVEVATWLALARSLPPLSRASA
ncbi:Ribosomal RNA small subunit methyltransferase A [bacterium HR40]|nr:Ribosomal RNA small subunit methyltransferase A [bacterium HR40]